MTRTIQFFPAGFGEEGAAVIEFPLENDGGAKTLLDLLLAEGIKIPHSCRAGLCQACVLQSDGSAPLNPEATLGLSDDQARQGLFMACQCYPAQSMAVTLPRHDLDWLATVIGRRQFSGDVLELSLQVEGGWNPGQHILLWMDDEHARPYSIVSVCDDEKKLVVHIQRHSDGLVSQWCHDNLELGSQVRLSPPQGHCVFDSHQTADLLLLAEGTGFGPLWGVAQQALRESQNVEIDLLYIDSPEMPNHADDMEYPQICIEESEAELSERFRLHLVSGELRGCGDDTERRSVWRNALSARVGNLSRRQVYVAGGAEFVALVSQVCFFAGVARRQMLTEVFAQGNGDDH